MAAAAPNLEESLTVERLDAANRTAVRGIPFAIAAVALVALLLGHSVSPARKAAWAAIMIGAVGFALAVAFAYEHKRKTGPVLRWSLGVVASASIGVGWGSLVFVAFPGDQYDARRAIILVFAVGISSVTVLSTAASRARFFALNGSMSLLLAIGYLRDGDGTTRLLGLAIPLYLAVMSLVHRQVHQLVMSEMRLKHELRDAAMHDGLTGVLNRRAFAHAIDQAVAQADRSGELVGVLYLDLDRFKTINDSYGHAAGDAVLVEIARRLLGEIRTGDSCGRLGGDEFALLLRNLADEEDVARVADRVLASIAEPVEVDGQALTISASVGGSTISDARDAAALLRESDAAQYRAKKAGGRRTVAFDERMRGELAREHATETALRLALQEGRIQPYFQPVVDLATGRVTGCEALARWLDADGHVMPAAAFLGVARAAGLMDAVDAGVIRRAFEARVALRSSGLPDDFRVWVNIDGHRLGRDNAQRHLHTLLAETGCRPHELGFEITEGEVLQDVDAAAELLARARAAGFKIALDDFGTGYSSLMLLRRLPIDVLKIDRAFVSAVAADESDRAICALIARIGGDLGMCVVAEGVENEADASVLRELGCNEAQGYLYAPALPFEQLRSFACADAPARAVTAATP